MYSRLCKSSLLAVDTESNSLYAYTERVCLIQFSIPGYDYLVDPLAINDLTPLGNLFADPGIEKVFHAAEYDVMVLRRDMNFSFANLFDTMIASRIVGWKQYGLGSLLKEHFGIDTDKRMQRTDWGRRPLSREQLFYAQLDTRFLLPLREKLRVQLAAQKRLGEAQAAFAEVAQSEWMGHDFDPDDFWRIKDVRELDAAGLSVMRALFIYRDQRAQAMDRPPFKVFNDQVLVQLSACRPKTLSELGQIKGIPRHLSDQRRQHLLQVIAQAAEQPVPERPAPDQTHRPSQAAEKRYELLRAWRKRRSEERGVEPDVILSNSTLFQLARCNPTSLAQLEESSILNDWERTAYGVEIVALLRQKSV
ncbi:MAG: ribonuclease D [Anaerolineae bacterium]|nr:ribonuclease D [Anaerolineae bacterium]